MNNTIFEGEVRHLTPAEGVSQKTGQPWKQLAVHVVNEEDRYPTDVEAVLFGERAIDRFPLAIGDKVRLYLDLHTREYNDRRYNQISIWKVEVLEHGQSQDIAQWAQRTAQAAPAPYPAPNQPMHAGAPAPYGGGYPAPAPTQPTFAPAQGGPNPDNDLPF